MSLKVPSRRASSTGQSFLTSPADVRSWVAELLESGATDWKHTLYRGLKHCNRIEINNRNRVEILTILEPAVDQALDQLVMLYYEQPLPLGRKPTKAHQLAGSLLQELGYAWQIVVNDTYSTLLQGELGLREHAILRALRVCSRRVLHHSLVYNPLPSGLLADANTLYRLAEDSSLSRNPQNLDDDSGTWTIEHAWMHIQLLSLSDLQTQRLTQIPLVVRLLETLTDSVDIRAANKPKAAENSYFAVHLEQDSPPVPTNQITPAKKQLLRIFDLANVTQELEKQITYAPTTLGREMATQQLQRSSLQRIVDRLQAGWKRDSQRSICYQSATLHTGLKDIHTYITSGQQSSRNADAVARGWRIVNNSKRGLCIAWDGQRQGELQVDELVALVSDQANELRIGRVVWMAYHDKDELSCGINILADKVAAVTAESHEADLETTKQACLLSMQSLDLAADNATLDNSDASSTTLLAPVNTFEHTKRVTIRQQNQHRDWSINLRRPDSGLFDHLDVTAVSAAVTLEN